MIHKLKQPLFVHLCILASYSLAVFALQVVSSGGSILEFFAHAPRSALLTASAPLIVGGSAVLAALAWLLGRPEPARLTDISGSLRGTRSLLAVIALVLAMGGIVAALVPANRWGNLDSYFEAARPGLVWAGLLGIHACCLLFNDKLQSRYRRTAAAIGPQGAPWLAFMLLLVLAIWLSVWLDSSHPMGVGHKAWYGSDAFVLACQVAVACILVLVFGRLEPSLRRLSPRGLDRLLPVLIWAGTAILWVRTPVAPIYYTLPPRAPNFEPYPYADSAGYYLQGLHAVSGHLLAAGGRIDNPIYPTLLALLQGPAGFDFLRLLDLQVIVLAILPVILYLITRQLAGLGAGLLVSILVAIWGQNAIATNAVVDVSNAKALMTEIPEAIALALVCWVAFRTWGNRWMPVAVGAASGIAFMVRPNAAFLMALPTVLALLSRATIKTHVRTALLVLIGFLLVLAPWGLRNQMMGGRGIAAFLGKATLVQQKRWGTERPIAPLEANGTWADTDSGGVAALVVDMLRHFLHNLQAASLVLPHTLVDESLAASAKTTLALSEASGPRARALLVQPAQLAGIMLSLVLVAVGLVASVRRRGLIALIPILMLLGYQFTNAVGMRSGGRYLTPTSWVMFIYFGIGILTIAGLLPEPEDRLVDAGTPRRHRFTVVQGILISCVLVAVSPVVVERAFALALGNAGSRAGETDSRLLSFGAVPFSQEEISAFALQPGSFVAAGVAKFPRYYVPAEVKGKILGAPAKVAYPNLFFTLFTTGSDQKIVLYSETVIPLQDGEEVSVLGCANRDRGLVRAIALQVQGPAERVYLWPDQQLECPVRQPVCVKGGGCQ